MSSPSHQTHFISSPSESHPQRNGSLSSDFASYPNLHHNDVAPPRDNWTSAYMTERPTQQPVDTQPSTQARAPLYGGAATNMPSDSNPYISPAPATPSMNTLDSVKDVLGRWGKKAAEATKRAEDLAGNMWQHCM